MATLSEACSAAIELDPLVAKYLAQFSSTLLTAKFAPYEKELSDPGHVLSPPYRFAPPKMRIFGEMIDDLLTTGLVKPSKSTYVSPAVLVPKNGGNFWMVVDYRKVNSEIVFYFHPCRIWNQLSSILGAL